MHVQLQMWSASSALSEKASARARRLGGMLVARVVAPAVVSLGWALVDDVEVDAQAEVDVEDAACGGSHPAMLIVDACGTSTGQSG